MFFWTTELLAPFFYLRVKTGDGGLTRKIFIDIILPAILSAITVFLSKILDIEYSFLGENGLFHSFSTAFQIFAAFFIAALAAVATFDRKGLDTNLKGDSAWITQWSNSKQAMVRREITRRMYICYLFSYLSGICLFFVIILPFSSIYGAAIGQHIKKSSESLYSILFLGFEYIFYFCVWSIFLLSLVAIRFLGDRLQNMDTDFQ